MLSKWKVKGNYYGLVCMQQKAEEGSAGSLQKLQILVHSIVMPE